MNRRIPARLTEHRTAGPAVASAGDGQEGIYSAVLHTAPSGGTCKVIIPALHLTNYKTANVSNAFTGLPGDMVLVAFDEEKQPWVISPTGVQVRWTPTWIAPTLLNSWANLGGAFETAGYLKDPLGFVHLKGVLQSGATNTVGFVLPAGYRPGAKTSHPGAGVDCSVNVDTSGNVTLNFSSGTVGLSGLTFLAEN